MIAKIAMVTRWPNIRWVELASRTCMAEIESRSLSPISTTRLHGEVPFEDLPNLPKPIIPKIDLGIERIELEALLQIRLVRSVQFSGANSRHSSNSHLN